MTRATFITAEAAHRVAYRVAHGKRRDGIPLRTSVSPVYSRGELLGYSARYSIGPGQMTPVTDHDVETNHASIH